MHACKLCDRSFPTCSGLGGHMSISHPKNGTPHSGLAKLKGVWETLTMEERILKSTKIRDARCCGVDSSIITEFQRQVIFGSLLGDMSITKHKHNTPYVDHSINLPRIRILHSSKQKDYVRWKYEILISIARTEPYEILQVGGFGDGSYSCRFETLSLPCLNPIYDIVIGESGKKHISQEWLDQITDPIALATWFMDDGSRGGGRGFYPMLSLGLTTDEEMFILQEWLIDIWELRTNYRRIKTGYNDNTKVNLRIFPKDIEKFRQLIEPYIIPSMRYKIDPSISYKECVCT